MTWVEKAQRSYRMFGAIVLWKGYEFQWLTLKKKEDSCDRVEHDWKKSIFKEDAF